MAISDRCRERNKIGSAVRGAAVSIRLLSNYGLLSASGKGRALGETNRKSFVATATASALLLSACGNASEDENRLPDRNATAIPVSQPISPVPEPAQPAPIMPDHNYEERRGWDYLYVAAVSEEDRKKGRAAGNVVTFQYLGLNGDGQHVLASMNTDGSVWRTASCKSQCRVIEYSDGRRIAYSPESVIGAAFQDAFRGKLRVADWAKDEVVEPMTAPVAAPPKGPHLIPREAAPADEPWENDPPTNEEPSEL